jgi:dolichol-phosphate mannosyltransferase
MRPVELPELVGAPDSCRDSPLELAVVIPTYNERDNVIPTIAALEAALSGIEWEAIFVDDHSPDGTAERLRATALTSRRVRVLERIGRRGLSSACIEGLLATAAPYIAVMDGDLQHDERLLPRMLERMKLERLDLVIASRTVGDGSMGDLTPWRTWLSRLGTRVSGLVCHGGVSDTMSGFFLIDRAFFRRVVHRLSGTGFKILVDILASSPSTLRVGELPYRFRNRLDGESKFDLREALEYVLLIVDKAAGDVLPTRFVLFVLVGSVGLALHLSILTLLYHAGRGSFGASQVIATAVAMTSNFLLNNVITFRDRRLRSWKLATGLLTFYLACSVGVFINVSLAEHLLQANVPWYLAGIAGMAISSVWNYGANTALTWRRTRAAHALHGADADVR